MLSIAVSEKKFARNDVVIQRTNALSAVGCVQVFGVPSGLSVTGVLKVEVQFHTPQSFHHKMAAHAQ